MSVKKCLSVLIVILLALNCFSQVVLGIGPGDYMPAEGVSIIRSMSQVPPKKIMAQGRITDRSGHPINNPSITFAIYTSSSDVSAIWSKTYTVITDENGFFTQVIGDANFPKFDLGSGNYYLGMSYEEADLGPRLLLASVPMALTACNILGGKVDVANSGIAVKGNSYGLDKSGVKGLNISSGANRVAVRGKISETVFGELGKRDGSHYYGVYGRADNGYGVYGISDTSAGVRGEYRPSSSSSVYNYGELGAWRRDLDFFYSQQIGVYGHSSNIGVNGSGDIGVYSYTTQEGSISVYGKSVHPTGAALFGASPTGYSLRVDNGEIAIRHQRGTDVDCALGTVNIPTGEVGVRVFNSYAHPNSCILVAVHANNESKKGYASVSEMSEGAFTISADRAWGGVRVEKTQSTSHLNAYRVDTRPSVDVDYLIIN